MTPLSRISSAFARSRCSRFSVTMPKQKNARPITTKVSHGRPSTTRWKWRRSCSARGQAMSSRRSADQAIGQPRHLREPLGLVAADLVGMAQRQADVVEAVDQAVLAERLHIERDLGAVRLG